MRYEDEKDKGKEKIEQEYIEDKDIDRFQEMVYNAGNQVLNLLIENDLLQNTDKKYEEAKKALEELNTFHYNIGFAGPQSCGKSSLINAIIGYPLMPTCNLATTCASVELVYNKEVRVIVKDEDQKGKIVFDGKCRDISQEDFNRLKNYACQVMEMEIAIIENLQLFSDVYIAGEETLNSDSIKMDRKDPRQVALLLLILFTVYVNQNSKKLDSKELELNELRKKILSYFGISDNTVNYRVIVQWDNSLLASGLIITDLPGLGSAAEDKEEGDKTIKGHNTITTEAILRTDAIAFIAENTVSGDAIPVLEKMISQASLRDSISVNDRIVVILNKVDLLSVKQKKTAVRRLLKIMNDKHVDMTDRKVWEISSLYGEYTYKEMDLSKTFFVQSGLEDCEEDEIPEKMKSLLEKLEEKYYQKSGIDELRKFFRKSFIERGKYQKIFSVVIILKDLALSADLIKTSVKMSTKVNQEISEGDRNIVKGALEELLKNKILEPLNKLQENIDLEIKKKYEKALYVAKALINEVGSEYVSTFTSSVDEYIACLNKISNELDLDFWRLRKQARVDIGNDSNHKVYEKLLDAIDNLRIDITEVNKSYIKVLQYCSGDIEEIYGYIKQQLIDFKESYSDSIKKLIDEYCKKMDLKIVTSIKGMIPALTEFVDTEIERTDRDILREKDSFEEVKDQVAKKMIDRNNQFREILLNTLKKKLELKDGGLFIKKKFLVVEGESGLKSAIKNLELNEEDKKTLRNECAKVGLDEIEMSLVGWYTDEKINISMNISFLIANIEKLLIETKKMIFDDISKISKEESNIKMKKEQLEKMVTIFGEMRQSIQSQIDHVLGSGIGVENENWKRLKGDLFEGKLTLEA